MKRFPWCAFRAAGVAAMGVALLSRAHAAPQPVNAEVAEAAPAQEAGEPVETDRPRGLLLLRMREMPMCFPHNMTPEQLDQAVRRWRLREPALGGAAVVRPGQDRFDLDTFTWFGDGLQGAFNQARRARLTISFPADGVTWGLPEVDATGPNELNARLQALFGTDNLDLGREFVRQAFGTWRRYGGLEYQEVADSGLPMDQVLTRRAAVGDVRIGGLPFGTGTFLAYNAFPSPVNAGVGGSDMVINTSFFLLTNISDPTDAFRYLRNVIAHEHGHGLGFIHQVPCNGTKLMEPLVNVGFDGLSIDDRRGAGRNFGDRFSGNHTPAAAIDFGSLTSPAPRSVIERDLSINGSTGPGNTNQDWFTFVLGADQPVTITAAPTGGSYVTGQQVTGCSGTSGVVSAAAAGDLRIDVYSDAAGTALVASAAAALPGLNEQLALASLPAGQYWVRVLDQGPNPPAAQIVQQYDLTIRVASAPARPYANAGINKLIAPGRMCHFMGDINSAPTEAGATITEYAWDLNGDGTFETIGPRPSRVYALPGTVPISLRVTDSNGQSAVDTITLTVVGPPAPVTITQVAPTTLTQGTSGALTITGSGLGAITGAGQVSVVGADLVFEGTPETSPDGTVLTGLTVTAPSSVPVGPRTLRLFTGQGFVEFPDAITITPLPVGACCAFPSCFIALQNSCEQLPQQRFSGVGTVCNAPNVSTLPCCPADANADGVISVQDIFTFLGFYFEGDFRADINGSFTFDVGDIFTFLSWYFTPCT